jgi:hypothetical protein
MRRGTSNHIRHQFAEPKFGVVTAWPSTKRFEWTNISSDDRAVKIQWLLRVSAFYLSAIALMLVTIIAIHELPTNIIGNITASINSRDR